jgi:hypothetical protein
VQADKHIRARLYQFKRNTVASNLISEDGERERKSIEKCPPDAVTPVSVRSMQRQSKAQEDKHCRARRREKANCGISRIASNFVFPILPRESPESTAILQTQA